ncbi:MAG: NAD-dependent epimerase/dehydratase family protein [Chloroflexota bacterium]|nr:NAD-dependent epimerase/dehydratase family protein [Chloroflexota bacterium]
MAQRVLVLGGDGYLGWPTAMHLSARGFDVAVVDNFAKREWERELGVQPLIPIGTLEDRVAAWREVSGCEIGMYVGDLVDYPFVAWVIADFAPDAIVHYGEQPSAPYSMIDVRHATYTQSNNVVGTLNVLFAMRDRAPDAHLVKLGTMGEYGTPDIDIEEGYLLVEHNGRRHEFLYPKTPGSIYHLSKVHDSHNIHFCCRIWALRATELNQGVVYGVQTDESARDARLATSLHYDEVFGTALNRFCVQAVAGEPITPYGRGGQTRGYLNIRDTMACVELVIRNPAAPGELRVYNQFTEQFTVSELADKVRAAAAELGIEATVVHAPNPRVEAEEHYYNARHTKLLELGLVPNLLGPELIRSMIRTIERYADRIDRSKLSMGVRWAPEPEARVARADRLQAGGHE